jgi:excisionase family DNA binding protein
MEKLYTVDEVAAQLKVHPRTIRRKIRSGEISALKVGKQYRIHRDHVLKLSGTENIAGPNEIASVSSVIELHNVSIQQSAELNAKMTSVFFSGGFTGSIHCSHDPQAKRLKLFVDCNIERAPEILSILKLYIHTILTGTANG